MAEPRRTHEFDIMARGFRREVERSRKTLEEKPLAGGYRPVLAVADPVQLAKLLNSLSARVQASDVGKINRFGYTIVTGDIGKFWFVENYSDLDLPAGERDIFRPE